MEKANPVEVRLRVVSLKTFVRITSHQLLTALAFVRTELDATFAIKPFLAQTIEMSYTLLNNLVTIQNLLAGI